MHGGLAIRSERGFTIVELGVVIVIMLVVSGALIVGVGAVRGTTLRTTAGRIDGAFRYVFRLASSNGVPYRMVFEMSGEDDEDNGAPADKWWAETFDPDANRCGSFAVTDVRKEKVRVHTETNRSTRSGSRDAQKEEEEESCPEEEKDAEGKCLSKGYRQAGGSKIEPKLSPQEMPKGMRIIGVMTTHQDEIQRRGKAYVHIFPNGFMEKAYIYLADDDDVYTIETFPLLGKVKIHHDELEPGEVLKDED